MKKIGLSLRVEEHEYSNERRDAIDQSWYSFFRSCGFLPVLLPNDLELTKLLINDFRMDGVVLSGGNTLASLGGSAPERDALENWLIKNSIQTKLPLFGVCRGMQVIQSYFGVELKKITGHVNKSHDLNFLYEKIHVNSFHDFGSTKTVIDLNVDARASDNIIEAVSHINLPIKGIMWHPERDTTPSKINIDLFKAHF
jgi:N5-(cytidine 5'-diphosphoramidyl)-L-glutamine hydrolase